MPHSKIKVGICGAGNIVNNHCRAIDRVFPAEVSAISSRTQKTARKMAKKYKIKKVYDDHRRVIESDDVDLVLVAAPNYQHFELGMRAIAAKKHVMIEKPLAVSVAEGTKLVAAAKKAGVYLLYAEQLPLAPKFAKLIRLTKEGAFGNPYMVRQIERHAGPYSPWFFDKATAGGGVLMDLGCHSISVLLELVRTREVKKVSALSRTYVHTRGNVEDFMLINLEFADNTVGVVECNWCHLGGMDSITEVFGETGVGRADMMKEYGIETFSEKGFVDDGDRMTGWRKIPFDALFEHGYVALAEGMVRTLHYDEPPLQSGEDGLEVLKIMDAAYKSAGTWRKK